jgi:hypothetical protein
VQVDSHTVQHTPPKRNPHPTALALCGRVESVHRHTSRHIFRYVCAASALTYQTDNVATHMHLARPGDVTFHAPPSRSPARMIPSARLAFASRLPDSASLCLFCTLSAITGEAHTHCCVAPSRYSNAHSRLAYLCTDQLPGFRVQL